MIRFQPGLNRLWDDMDRAIGCVLEDPRKSGRLSFPVNVWEDEKHLFAEAELPGIKMENIEVSVMGDELTIRGRRLADGEGVNYHRRERGPGEFVRALRLPVDIDADGVKAGLRDGVLLITMPKAAAVLPRKIEVKAG